MVSLRWDLDSNQSGHVLKADWRYHIQEATVTLTFEHPNPIIDDEFHY